MKIMSDSYSYLDDEVLNTYVIFFYIIADISLNGIFGTNTFEKFSVQPRRELLFLDGRWVKNLKIRRDKCAEMRDK